MTKRIVDVLLAAIALIIFSPFLIFAALGILCSSRGPIIYRARRVGKGGRLFTMYKFRTMRVNNDEGQSRITAGEDPRIFTFGAFLRNTKIDELPQLLNILRGDMAVIGPRAEDPDIVEQHYSRDDRETLEVHPGLSSPGSLHYFINSEKLIDGEDAEQNYLQEALPIKLALDRVYVRKASLLYDLKLIWRTMVIVVLKILGQQNFSDPPELAEAKALKGEEQGREYCGQSK